MYFRWIFKVVSLHPEGKQECVMKFQNFGGR